MVGLRHKLGSLMAQLAKSAPVTLGFTATPVRETCIKVAGKPCSHDLLLHGEPMLSYDLMHRRKWIEPHEQPVLVDHLVARFYRSNFHLLRARKKLIKLQRALLTVMETLIEPPHFPVDTVNQTAAKEKQGGGRPEFWEMVFWWTSAHSMKKEGIRNRKLISLILLGLIAGLIAGMIVASLTQYALRDKTPNLSYARKKRFK
jgi:hypothetical protein